MPLEAPLSIGPVRALRVEDRSRVEVELAGETLWFETGDVELAPAIEGIASAILPSSLFHQRRLQLNEPICATWRQGVDQACQLLHRWWRFAPLAPRADQLRPAAASTAPGVGLFFTGGVDSFYSLLRFPRRIDHLIYVVDYDVPPQAPQRFSEFEPHLRTIARACDATAIVLRTNLRRHPAMAGPSWQQSHGAALVGAAHLLNRVLGEVVVSSSYSRFHPRPWGSHWELDPLWSSAALRVTHFGEDHRRFDKLATIVDNELLQRFVRPCWENPPQALNCSVCEKCVRTQISIAACGDLRQFEAFDGTSLVEKINNLRRIGAPELLSIYADFLQLPALAPLHSAIARLIQRSRFSALRKTLRREFGRQLRVGRPCRHA